ncbi:MAG: carbamate kinase [Candidatus Methanomethylicota archaeon]|uniref:Carbamate kinase n=1 Tax=Thermoproteota archaeon TaxID=2056631 RepID=A0A497F2H4_9CREN|nr:MAG: carbamate kinase [Candidatus Verstraetearchaeota archaeon]
MTKRILVALGGNAIKKADEIGTAEEQFRNVKKTCEHLVQLIKMGYQLVITHGNGPQVGNLMIQQEEAESKVPPQPLDVLGAMTQGQIGYMLQQTLQNILRKDGIEKRVVTVITQVLVDKNDPAFNNPTKPVGPFYSKEEAEEIAKIKGYIIKKVKPGEGKVYRRVVPSPDPIEIIEGDAIRAMVEEGMIVIASGGGGIPVIYENGELKGVEAVIDKDLAGERLAEVVKADILLILTDIDKVRINFGKPNEKPIDKMTVEEAKKYLAEGHFLPGSMGPKVLACIRFLEWGGEKAIIAALDQAVEAIEGKAGTLIYRG